MQYGIQDDISKRLEEKNSKKMSSNNEGIKRHI